MNKTCKLPPSNYCLLVNQGHATVKIEILKIIDLANTFANKKCIFLK